MQLLRSAIVGREKVGRMHLSPCAKCPSWSSSLCDDDPDLAASAAGLTRYQAASSPAAVVLAT
jgi:hypothetical protein